MSDIKEKETTSVSHEKENQRQDLSELVTELRSTITHVNKSDGEKQEKIEKIEKALEKHDERNQELVMKLKQAENSAKELKESYEFLEKKMATMPQTAEGKEEISKEMEAFDLYLKEGANHFSIHSQAQELHKYLNTFNNVNGGYLAPIERIKEIIKKKTEISPIRSVARIMSTTSKSVEISKRNTLMVAKWGAEGLTAEETQSAYGNLTIDVKQLNADVAITRQLLSQSDFDMGSEIYGDAAETFAQVEGQAFVLGAGPLQPQGLITAPGIQSVPTGSATDITSDSLIKITGELKTGYNPAYMFNRRTLAFIRNLRDLEGRFLWTPTLAEGEPARINGEVYVLAIDLPDHDVANSNPVLYGDFYAGYRIVDSMSLEAFRDDYTLSSKRMVVFRFTEWVGGQVVLEEAIKKLVVSVS